MIPWVYYAIYSGGPIKGADWSNIWKLKFWITWITHALGYGLDYSLGKHADEFSRLPWVAAAYALIGLAAAAIVYFVISRRWKEKSISLQDESMLALVSTGVGCGMLMTLTGIDVHRYYLTVVYPFEYYWLARVACADGIRGQRLLALIAACQLVISVSFLNFIHLNHGAPGADYGIGYQWQQPGFKPLTPRFVPRFARVCPSRSSTKSAIKHWR